MRLRHVNILLSLCLFAGASIGQISDFQSKFNSLEAESKSAWVWDKVERTKYEQLPPIEVSAWDQTNLLCPEFDSKAFAHDGDFMIPKREKLIHGFGPSILVRFVPKSGKRFGYTGLFKTGATGIARFSLALPPTEKSITPGAAFKFWVKEKPSANIMAMPGLGGQPERNIFERVYLTDLPKPDVTDKSFVETKKLEFLEDAFVESLEYVNQKGGNPRSLKLDHLAKWTDDGQEVSEPDAPYSLMFLPTEAAKNLMAKATVNDDFRATLEGQGNGITLFEVCALSTKGENIWFVIGEIVAESNFVNSRFGDKELFFKHNEVHPADAD